MANDQNAQNGAQASDDKKHARYLQDPETGHVSLVVADQVDQKKAAGWTDPEGIRPNGQKYNQPEDQDVIDLQGEALEATQAAADKKAQAANEAQEKANQANLEARKNDDADTAKKAQIKADEAKLEQDLKD